MSRVRCVSTWNLNSYLSAFRLYYKPGSISQKVLGYKMATTGLSGPYNLTTDGVSAAVRQKSPGAYALGATKDDSFAVHYVGRSDTDVAGRLQQHVSEWYPLFKCGYLASPKAAFEKECHLYHDFNPPDNKVHPARPSNSNWSCPVCNIFG